MFNSIINKLISNPRKLFLMDGIGALITIFFLSIVLIKLNHLIGMPEKTLYLLSGLVCLFAFYSFSCFRFLTQNYKPFIKVIASANTLYCLISISLLFIYKNELLPLGYIYFIVEKIILVLLIFIEFKVASNLKTKDS